MMPKWSASSARFLASSLLANWWFTTTSFIASASPFANLLTNSPYLPSLECLRRSRHKGSARARISSSVLSMMFTPGVLPSGGMAGLLFVHQVVAGRLLHGVFAGLRIAARDREHVPVLVVHLHHVAAIVVARPARLLAEERVLRHALRGPVAVHELPGAQQLVQVLRGQALEVLLHDRELLR